MESFIKKYNLILFGIIFIITPILLFTLGDFPKKTILKNALSLLTLISFSLVLGQFFLSRTNSLVQKYHTLKNIIKIHKFIGYFVVIVFLLHPFLLVVPRFFEVGVDPIDSFIKIITTFDSLGIIFGLIAWGCMFLLGFTSMFRNKLPMSYKNWRVFHGLLSVFFIFIATLHSIDLGKHTDLPISIFFITLAIFAILLVMKTYFFSNTIKETQNG